MMRVLAPAKLNLHLRVGPKQSDGFHPVNTWMVTVGLFDKLDFSLDTAGR
ncbi:MAG: 4-(cytidine 5'-diphospho)-2-C-methyl-D-erythritol kinase, partial [Burkholderiales bacterium]|nr:4-(cytidine 5'-diphospho)-2-C-methyl-D-erythritol kinase [Phycisphaerae bacterium]